MGIVRIWLKVEGVVQGVGFRPFVYSLANRLGLAGVVSNDSAGVTLEVEGNRADLDRFVAVIEREAPPLAVIERMTSGELPPRGDHAFVIAPSQAGPERTALISPDVATCEDCLRELFDPSDRRFRYPFINCTNCGPRFTIIRGVPYDRAATTMVGFAMCADCAREYSDPADRRFHAQPVACPACGPCLVLLDSAGSEKAEEPIAGAARLIRAGGILAVKGLGGYHLAADAADERAVAALRARKHREDKPFAVMAPDGPAAARLADIGPAEARVLEGVRRPIVLVRRWPHAAVAAATAPGTRLIGIMLPYTPVHHLLARALGSAIVLTSGNVSDEPIAYRDDDARERLGGIAAAFLTHDRPIHIRTDDSVVRCVRGSPVPIRRARGYAPQPVALVRALSRPLLACGAELKNTVCVAKGRHAFLSQHIGDLENYEALRSFAETIAHLQRLFDVRPEIVAHDLHPEYLSTKWAMEQPEVALVAVQHHHAHVASCLADNGEAGPVIGVAFDGLGYGTDGTLWGGEFLLADLGGFERAGHLAPVPMPGGVAAIREPWRMAAIYLEQALGEGASSALAVARRHEDRWCAVLEVVRSGLNAPLTSSMGRLFDAVAALVGVRDTVSYEGQAAIELEQIVEPAEALAYEAALDEGVDGFLVRGADLVRAVVADLQRGVATPVIAARFHNGVARIVLDGCRVLRRRSGRDTVALSGGVFQNATLLDRAAALLESDGFRVLTHRQVPANDGGISLGQVVVAAHASP